MRQQLDTAVGDGDPARVEPGAQVVADREPRVAEVIGGAHLDQVAAVDREERDLLRELVELVQIEQQLVDPVAERVVRRGVALVLEHGVIERGAGAHACSRERAIGGREAAHGAVLVEAPAQVGAGVVGAAHAQLRLQALARRDGVERVDGVLIGHARDHVTFGDALRLVQRDAELGRVGEGVQAVQRVRDAHRPVVRAAVAERDVPGRARRDAARQQGVAAVDDGLVARVRHARERSALLVARILEQRERLLRVAREDHAVEALGRRIARADLDGILAAADAA